MTPDRHECFWRLGVYSDHGANIDTARRWAGGKGQRADILRCVLAEMDRLQERLTDQTRRARVAEQTAADLAKHLRDRDAHIRNLEAELLPHLLNSSDGEQEALL